MTTIASQSLALLQKKTDVRLNKSNGVEQVKLTSSTINSSRLSTSASEITHPDSIDVQDQSLLRENVQLKGKVKAKTRASNKVKDKTKTKVHLGSCVAGGLTIGLLAGPIGLVFAMAYINAICLCMYGGNLFYTGNKEQASVPKEDNVDLGKSDDPTENERVRHPDDKGGILDPKHVPSNSHIYFYHQNSAEGPSEEPTVISIEEIPLADIANSVIEHGDLNEVTALSVIEALKGEVAHAVRFDDGYHAIITNVPELSKIDIENALPWLNGKQLPSEGVKMGELIQKPAKSSTEMVKMLDALSQMTTHSEIVPGSKPHHVTPYALEPELNEGIDEEWLHTYSQNGEKIKIAQRVQLQTEPDDWSLMLDSLNQMVKEAEVVLRKGKRHAVPLNDSSESLEGSGRGSERWLSFQPRSGEASKRVQQSATIHNEWVRLFDEINHTVVKSETVGRKEPQYAKLLERHVDPFSPYSLLSEEWSAMLDELTNEVAKSEAVPRKEQGYAEPIKRHVYSLDTDSFSEGEWLTYTPQAGERIETAERRVKVRGEHGRVSEGSINAIEETENKHQKDRQYAKHLEDNSGSSNTQSTSVEEGAVSSSQNAKVSDAVKRIQRKEKLDEEWGTLLGALTNMVKKTEAVLRKEQRTSGFSEEVVEQAAAQSLSNDEWLNYRPLTSGIKTAELIQQKVDVDEEWETMLGALTNMVKKTEAVLRKEQRTSGFSEEAVEQAAAQSLSNDEWLSYRPLIGGIKKTAELIQQKVDMDEEWETLLDELTNTIVKSEAVPRKEQVYAEPIKRHIYSLDTDSFSEGEWLTYTPQAGERIETAERRVKVRDEHGRVSEGSINVIEETENKHQKDRQYAKHLEGNSGSSNTQSTSVKEGVVSSSQNAKVSDATERIQRKEKLDEEVGKMLGALTNMVKKTEAVLRKEQRTSGFSEETVEQAAAQSLSNDEWLNYRPLTGGIKTAELIQQKVDIDEEWETLLKALTNMVVKTETVLNKEQRSSESGEESIELSDSRSLPNDEWLNFQVQAGETSKYFMSQDDRVIEESKDEENWKKLIDGLTSMIKRAEGVLKQNLRATKNEDNMSLNPVIKPVDTDTGKETTLLLDQLTKMAQKTERLLRKGLAKKIIDSRDCLVVPILAQEIHAEAKRSKFHKNELIDGAQLPILNLGMSHRNNYFELPTLKH